MAHQWFIVRDGKEQGPFTAGELKDHVEHGRLTPDDHVRRGDLKAARRASSIKGLFAEVVPVVQAVAPPPLPTSTAKSKSRRAALAGAFAGVACLLMLCAGIASLFTSRPGPRMLTAEFYPFRPGTVQHSTANVVFNYKDDEGKTKESLMKSVREYTHENDGVIVERKTDHFLVPTNTKLPLGEPKRWFYREKDGYIEIGHEITGLKETVWEPIVKIGAKVGEGWERETSPGVVTEHYEVERLEPQEVEFKDGSNRKILVAYIAIRSKTKVSDGNVVQTGQDVRLGQGVGLIHRSSWRIEGGKQMTSWYEHFTPNKP
jgi:hypothetical protein